MGSRVERGAVPFAAWVAPFLLLAGCSLPPLTSLHPAPQSQAQRGGHYLEEGTASWYGPGFLGGRTSSGEIYNIGDMTAAHQTLPLGTRVVVTNLSNSRSVEVRVNDRGPFAKGRILDLSYAAARELALVGPGTARVRVESVDDGDGPLGVVAYAVQAGAFQDGTKAFALRQSLAGRYDKVYLSPLRTEDALYYRVRVGPFERREQAVTFAQQLARGGVPAMIVEEVSR
jgi:rare lipoprotein A